MTLIDTSPLYGHGLSEHRVGTALRRVGRDGVVLSTKVGRVMTPARGAWDREGYAGGLPFAAAFDYSFDGALRSLEQSLLRLGTDRIDIVLVHDIDRRNHGDGLPERIAEVMAGAWPALERLKDEGVVRAIGLGVNEAEVCVRFAERCAIDVALLAGRYSLLEQGPLDDFLPIAQARGIGVMLGGVFNSGILATGPVAGAKYDYGEARPTCSNGPGGSKRFAAGTASRCPSRPFASLRSTLPSRRFCWERRRQRRSPAISRPRGPMSPLFSGTI